MEKYWFLRTEKEILSELKSSRKGLSSNETKKRLAEDGFNTIAREEKNRGLKIFLKNFNSILIFVLFGSAIISLLSSHMIEFYIIMAIIVITGILGFVQEYRAGKSLDALKKLTPKKVDVIRDGKTKTINAEELVRGDIIVMRRGMIAPADIRVLESNSLVLDESILTGESIQKSKHANKLNKQDILISDQDNMVFGGTSITSGKGIGVVVETGLESEIGKISEELKEIKDEKSPLQIKIGRMSKRIAYGVIILCIFLYLILNSKGVNTYEALLLLGAVAVSGIPESFPLALTLSLSNGVKRMASKNAILRDLSSVETLGTTTVICTDKTGTLTENKMVVEKIFFADHFEVDVKGAGYNPEGTFSSGKKIVMKEHLQTYEHFFHTCVLCNNSETFFEGGQWTLRGEPTEGAILTIAKSTGFDDVEIKEEQKLMYEVPFDPAKKYMITINSKGKKVTAYMKGSAEKVLERSTFARSKSSKIIKLNKAYLNKIIGKMHAYSDEGYRVIAIATKNIEGKDKKLDSGFVFEGLVAIKDPIRKDVYDSIKECMNAGIKLIMVTGDHKRTAEAIGKQLGIVNKKRSVVLEGHEVDSMSDEELDKIIGEVAIFARTTPQHKLRIVSSLQRKGEIVAMTGDGVNDAPALKKADIGVSMGKEGTDVARESSNMILTDDSFSTIVSAIREGRTIYSNIRRFVFYLLTGNFTEVSIIVLAIIIGLITPLTALMVLFINLVTSTFPAIALSVEPTHHKVMYQKPRNPKERLLSKYILLKILVLVPVLMLGTMLMFQLEYQTTGSIEKARTMAFAVLIMFELFHVFNARSLHTSIFNKNFFSNKYIFYAITGSVFLMIMSIHTTIGQKIFGTVPLSGLEWLIIVLLSSSVIWISEIIKMMIKSEFDEQMSLKGMHMEIE